MKTPQYTGLIPLRGISGAIDCRKAADLIMGAFSWSATRKGHRYWSRVHARLLQLATEIEAATPPEKTRRRG